MIENNLERILNVLKNNNQSATFFCLGWIAREFPHLVQMIDQMGFEVGTHSNLHNLAYNQTKSEFREDLIKQEKFYEEEDIQKAYSKMVERVKSRNNIYIIKF